jgi:hypothetical protein
MSVLSRMVLAFSASGHGGTPRTDKMTHMTTRCVPALIGGATLALALIGCGVDEPQKRPPKEQPVTVPLVREDDSQTYELVSKQAKVRNGRHSIFGAGGQITFEAERGALPPSELRDHQFEGFVHLNDGKQIKCQETGLDPWQSSPQTIEMWCFDVKLPLSRVKEVVITTDFPF